MRFGAVFPTVEIGKDPGAIRAWVQAVQDIGFERIVAYDHVLGAVHADREPINDVARNLERWVDAVVIRTFAQRDIEEFAEFARIPTVNALTDDEHPCQILTDIFTFEEARGVPITGRVVTFVGDGACNVPASWIWAAARLDFAELAPLTFERPDSGRFPSLRLARQALLTGGIAPIVLNASNEVAVAAFLAGRIGFLDIARVVEDVMVATEGLGAAVEGLQHVQAAELAARRRAEAAVQNHSLTN